jgi:sulfonate transport system permease protein
MTEVPVDAARGSVAKGEGGRLQISDRGFDSRRCLNVYGRVVPLPAPSPKGAAPARPLPFRRVISPLVILAIWQAGSIAGLIPARIIASPAAIIVTAYGLLVSGELLPDLWVSLVRAVVGLAIGVSLGMVFALIAGLSRIGEDAVDPPMQMLRAVPLLGLTPLFILWFGISEVPKIALIALASFFPVYITLFSGIRAVDRKLIEAAQVFGLNRWAVIREVILPGSLPAALVGIRQSLGIAWLSLVVAEQINADYGIGHLIMNARDFLRTDVIVVGLAVYALLGLATDAVVRVLERRALRWRPSILKGAP